MTETINTGPEADAGANVTVRRVCIVYKGTASGHLYGVERNPV